MSDVSPPPQMPPVPAQQRRPGSGKLAASALAVLVVGALGWFAGTKIAEGRTESASAVTSTSTTSTTAPGSTTISIPPPTTAPPTSAPTTTRPTTTTTEPDPVPDDSGGDGAAYDPMCSNSTVANLLGTSPDQVETYFSVTSYRFEVRICRDGGSYVYSARPVGAASGVILPATLDSNGDYVATSTTGGVTYVYTVASYGLTVTKDGVEIVSDTWTGD